MLPGPNQLRERRARIALLRQLVQVCEADIVSGQRVLRVGVGPLETAFLELGGKRRIRGELERAGGDAVAGGAFEAERPGVAPDAELYGAARA